MTTHIIISIVILVAGIVIGWFVKKEATTFSAILQSEKAALQAEIRQLLIAVSEKEAGAEDKLKEAQAHLQAIINIIEKRG